MKNYRYEATHTHGWPDLVRIAQHPWFSIMAHCIVLKCHHCNQTDVKRAMLEEATMSIVLAQTKKSVHGHCAVGTVNPQAVKTGPCTVSGWYSTRPTWNHHHLCCCRCSHPCRLPPQTTPSGPENCCCMPAAVSGINRYGLHGPWRCQMSGTKLPGVR